MLTYIQLDIYIRITPPQSACQRIKWKRERWRSPWLLHKVKDRPFAEGSRDLHRCQSSIFEIEINNFERYDLIVNITTKSSQYLPYYIHYRRFPCRMVKVYTPPTTNKHQSMACSKQRVPPTYNNPGGVFFNYFDLFWSFGSWDWASRLPALSREWGAESTPLENNPPSMEDIGSPSWNMSCSSIQNRISFEGLEFGTYNLLGTAGKYRI